MSFENAAQFSSIKPFITHGHIQIFVFVFITVNCIFKIMVLLDLVTQ